MPKIAIKRPSTLFNQARSYKVFINNQQVGKLGNGETLEFDVQSGENQVQVKLDWTSSQFYSLNLSEDSEEKLTVHVSKSASILMIIAGILIGANLIGKSFYENKALSFILVIPAILIIFYSFTLGRKKHLVLSNSGNEDEI
jgi:hypothetical protein